jgi:DNA-binding NarL/FixJ family response regulator
LLTEGRNIKEISTVMSIAEDTARQYLKNCFKKMEVNKQHELVCLALDSLRKR